LFVLFRYHMLRIASNGGDVEGENRRRSPLQVVTKSNPGLTVSRNVVA
jgi:hypothetical protein